jgi:mRNA-degrading endonuclease toxin of MazEF toxin-antitoxin module
VIVAKVDKVKMATVIPLTTGETAGNLPHVLPIKVSENNGLKETSFAMIFQLRSLSFDRFDRKLGTLDDKDYRDAQELMKRYLDL